MLKKLELELVESRMTERLQAIEDRLEVLGKKVKHGLHGESRRLRKENEDMNFHLKQLQRV
jgi:hypothetical protein